ncbi:MAG: T9SS type A sorting domain-containing protein [Bacteroidetes bacterium]|nr:T9SS type A sorting domain-containing protein [Bacteroidota bacterium]
MAGLLYSTVLCAQVPSTDREPATDTVLPSHPFAHTPGKTADTEFVKSLRLQGALPSLFLFNNRFASDTDSLLFWKSKTVARTLSVAIDPPDYGVFTFDGLNGIGQPYSTVLSSGPADSLVSHFIVLHPDSLYPNGMGAPRAIEPADSLYFTFFFQAGGRADFPEVQDSLVLYFRDSTHTGPTRWIPVWAMSSFDENNDPLDPERFYQAIVPIDDPRFFHEQFQFKFQNKANLNGLYDVWHVDRIFIYSGATTSNPFLFRDIGVSGVTRRIRGVYTQLPVEAAAQVTAQEPFSARLFNLSIFDATSIPVTFSATDLINGQSQTEPPQLTDIPQQQGMTVTLPGAPFPAVTDSARLRFRVYTSLNSFNQISLNDTLDFIAPLDSLLAVDDGEADTGFGLNTTFRQQFGQKFVLPSPPDTLQAVWMSFLPRYNVPSGKGFELVIWNARAYHPDSVLHKQLANADQGETHNHFARFILNPPLILPDSFIVGIRQFDNIPINLGVDKDFDYNRNGHIVYDNLGQWLVAPFEGTLMIRLELSGKYYPSVGRTAREDATRLRLYPNPSVTGQLTVDGLYRHLHAQPMQLTICDLAGRQVHHEQRSAAQFPYTIAAAGRLAPGVYQVQIQLGNEPLQVFKWIRQ